jgi:hypothetical protein
MLRKLQGAFESLLTRQYRRIAHDMHLQTVTWDGMEIVGTRPVVDAISSALRSLGPAEAKYIELIRRNIKSVLCIENALTNTFPVAGACVIASASVENAEERNQVALLVQAAAYIQFYKKRHIFLPKFFQGRTDIQARSEARQFAMEFQGLGHKTTF